MTWFMNYRFVLNYSVEVNRAAVCLVTARVEQKIADFTFVKSAIATI